MKKFGSVLLSALLLFTCFCPAFADTASDSFGEYEHVFIIGVDGAGAAFRQVNTPNLDRIFEDNALRYDAHTEFITISAQNWGSILCGVSYLKHGFTNDNLDKNERGSDSDNNSIFYYARKAMPEASLVSVNNWASINHGIIENDIGVEKINCADDALVTEAVIECVTRETAPKLLFVHMDSADHAAHTYGGFSKEYADALEQIDVYLGEIYDAIDGQGLMENSLFILVTDHGETTYGHGGLTKEESSAIVAVAGHSVNRTELSCTVRNRDVAAIVLYALGIEQPDHFTCSVPAELFGESREKTVRPNPGKEENADKYTRCNYCGGVHTDTFFGKFTAAFHQLFYLVLHIFGKD